MTVRQCAWCRKILDTIDDGCDSTTHGICEPCHEELCTKPKRNPDDDILDKEAKARHREG